MVLGVYRCFDECLPLAMISRTKACLKVLAAKQVELQKVRRTRLFGRSISWIDYGWFEICIVCVLWCDVNRGVRMKRVRGEWQVDKTRLLESIVLVVGWRMDAIWVGNFSTVDSSFRSFFDDYFDWAATVHTEDGEGATGNPVPGSMTMQRNVVGVSWPSLLILARCVPVVWKVLRRRLITAILAPVYRGAPRASLYV